MSRERVAIERLAGERMKCRHVPPWPGRIARRLVGGESDEQDVHPINPGDMHRHRVDAACAPRHTFPVGKAGAILPGCRGPTLFRVAVLLALLTTAMAPLLFTGCSSSKPEGAVRDFIRARLEGDEKRAAGLTVEGDLSEFLGGEAFLAGSGVSFTAEAVEISGDRARVVVHFRWGEGEELDISYICRREGPRWKVSLRETEEFWLPDLELLREEGDL